MLHPVSRCHGSFGRCDTVSRLWRFCCRWPVAWFRRAVMGTTAVTPATAIMAVRRAMWSAGCASRWFITADPGVITIPIAGSSARQTMCIGIWRRVIQRGEGDTGHFLAAVTRGRRRRRIMEPLRVATGPRRPGIPDIGPRRRRTPRLGQPTARHDPHTPRRSIRRRGQRRPRPLARIAVATTTAADSPFGRVPWGRVPGTCRDQRVRARPGSSKVVS